MAYTYPEKFCTARLSKVEATSPKLVLSFGEVADTSAKLSTGMGQNFPRELYIYQNDFVTPQERSTLINTLRA